MGTQYRSEIVRPLTARHKYLDFSLIVRDVDLDELNALTRSIHRLPFVWAEAGGSNYYCQIPIPLDYVNEVLVYLKGVVGPFGNRASYWIGHPDDARSFSITPKLYDQKTKKWTFNLEETLAKFDSLFSSAKRAANPESNQGHETIDMF
jgi:hypothetical protein